MSVSDGGNVLSDFTPCATEYIVDCEALVCFVRGMSLFISRPYFDDSEAFICLFRSFSFVQKRLRTALQVNSLPSLRAYRDPCAGHAQHTRLTVDRR